MSGERHKVHPMSIHSAPDEHPMGEGGKQVEGMIGGLKEWKQIGIHIGKNVVDY
jgi:hypothetical protein